MVDDGDESAGVDEWVEARRERTASRQDVQQLIWNCVTRCVQMDDGTYPWLRVTSWSSRNPADQAAHRIRHAKIKLPDLDGGYEGVWDAKVEVRGVMGLRGKPKMTDLWVRYKGVRGEMIGMSGDDEAGAEVDGETEEDDYEF